MGLNLGINGFGRIGRLVFRIAMDSTDVKVVQINDPAGNSETFSHLVNFDSVHGRWNRQTGYNLDGLLIDGLHIRHSKNSDLQETDWSGCDVVVEASGQFRSIEKLESYCQQGVRQVVVTAPLLDDKILNVVMGVNDHLYRPKEHGIVTAASCTTNCLAPIVKVIHENLGICHGSMTTIHAITTSQRILDAPHSDLRRARACGMSLIPTTTGSAKAISRIFPDLEGRLNGHAIRTPLANASLTDCVFEVKRPTSVGEVNRLLAVAAEGPLQGILGYEERPLVSIDYRTDPRSSIVDALSTMVINQSQVKIYSWYDNEWGYANRVVDLVRLIGCKLGLVRRMA